MYLDSLTLVLALLRWPLIILLGPICLLTVGKAITQTIGGLRTRWEETAGTATEQGRDVPPLSSQQKVLYGVLWPFTASMMVCILVMASTEFHPDEASYRREAVLALVPIVLLLTTKINTWVVWLPLRDPLQALAAGAIIPFLELLLLGGVLGSGAR